MLNNAPKRTLTRLGSLPIETCAIPTLIIKVRRCLTRIVLNSP